MIGKVLICNRGEIAVRILRACRDLGVPAAVAYSAADCDSLAVRLADESVCVGPATAARSYRNVPALLYACAKVGADAVHPGYGFLAEDPVFAATVADVGLTFIGPTADQIALLGDKIAARSAMRAVGVPVLPGSDGPVSSYPEAARAAAEIGYPVIVKAAAGGGGRGIAIVRDPDVLEAELATVRAAARAMFQDDRVYLERYVERARHVEVQVLADAQGTVVHLGERDCSVQRRQQKLVEESPSPQVGPALREQLCAAAVAGARAIGYRSAGTFEFLVDDAGEAHFIEMNPRLQVEHPVTEARSGIDLVGWMIRIAGGEQLDFTQDDVELRGHAIEARVNAEDPARGFVGSAGRVTGLTLPAGGGVRVDTHLFEGCEVPPHYDSLLAKVIVSDRTRAGALDRLDRALGEFRVTGVTTNLAFHRDLLDHPSFRAGTYRLDIVESVLARTDPTVDHPTAKGT